VERLVKHRTRTESARTAALGLLAAGALAGACGGSGETARVPAEKTTAPVDPSPSTAAESAAEPAAPPAARQCSDGTCFACGTGYCPTGYFCDEGATGGAACSWLPACGKSACACLKRALGGCACDDGEGGAHVRCN